ncbi:hypothetical protein LXA43DRAFT_1098697 [Ganoderma leucocontextum]|nr:hypothetical protein LXA43DRAFT_1098697 [Ganoderma leucocontextum]
MSTGKRSGSPLDAVDVRPTKKPDTTSDTPVSEQPGVPSLELLPENKLPHREELKRLNNLIHGEIEKVVSDEGIDPSDIGPVLDTVNRHCNFMERLLPWPSLHRHRRALVQMAQDAYKDGDYSRLMRLEILQRSPEEVKPPSGSLISSQVPKAVVQGWNTPFIGTAHMALARNIQEMFKKAIDDSPDRKHMTHASIIQSSGSGKSRLVDKVAETIFTIPFNIRDQRDAAIGAWPPADNEIRRLLVGWANDRGGETRLSARYLSFFTAVFEEIRKEVERCIPEPASAANTASAWRGHLAEKESENRNTLYTRVVNSDAITKAEALPLNVESVRVDALRKTARGALNQLLHTVCVRCHMSHTDNADSAIVEDLHVLIYFDDAHVLSDQRSSSISEGKPALEVLFSVLDDFRSLGLFTVFMSTQSDF